MMGFFSKRIIVPPKFVGKYARAYVAGVKRGRDGRFPSMLAFYRGEQDAAYDEAYQSGHSLGWDEYVEKKLG
jgi:hypothetical protein